MSIKSIVERRAPRVASWFRATRDWLAFLVAARRRLPEGGVVIGGSSLATERFEAEERKLVIRDLETTDVFIDVGANIGLYTVIARSHGVRVVAIEPHPMNLRYLRRALHANGWNDVEVQAVGVAGENGEASLYGGATGASLVRGWAAVSEEHAQTVRITTLDALLADRFEGDRLFVKIDIEGGEYDALRGASSLLRRTPRPRWLVEITLVENRAAQNPHFAATFQLFFEAGYRAFAATAPMIEITPEDVQEWSADRVHNFLFR